MCEGGEGCGGQAERKDFSEALRLRPLPPGLPSKFHLEFRKGLRLHSCKVITSVWQCWVSSEERHHLSLLPGQVMWGVLNLQQMSRNSLTSLENSEYPKHGGTC